MIATRSLLDALGDVAREAGAAILAEKRRGFDVETKADQSPVSSADHAAERVVLAGLARHAPGVPVVSEEEAAAGRIPAFGDSFFLVDPLDGTRSFIDGGADYGVNIGLIERGVPTLGIIFCPETDELHLGVVGEGAWRVAGGERCAIATRERAVRPVAVHSRNHLGEGTVAYLEATFGADGYEPRPVGSSLKFCHLADGRADLYPRVNPTSEWDIAAGHALLLAAGGRMEAKDGGCFAYGKPQFLNEGFVATGGWQAPPIAPFADC